MPPSKKYQHPNPRPDLIDLTVDQIKRNYKDIADVYLTPHPVPDLPDYVLPNNGADATPVRVEVQFGTIHEPDGTPRGPGSIMVMPQYVADDWLKEGRIKLAK